MDFRSRGVQSPMSSPASTSASSTSSSNGSSSSNKHNLGKWLERGTVVLLISVAFIILAVAGLTFVGGNTEARAINQDKYQAVFLNNGQVYFGNIKRLNTSSINLQNIYYLQTNSAEGQAAAEANSNVSLVKLGCELHAPYDQMIINRDQVIFWENLQDNSQVVKAIAQYKKDNPKGQTCSTASQNSTQQAPATNTQSSTAPTTGTGAPAAPAPTTPTTRRP